MSGVHTRTTCAVGYGGEENVSVDSGSADGSEEYGASEGRFEVSRSEGIDGDAGVVSGDLQWEPREG